MSELEGPILGPPLPPQPSDAQWRELGHATTRDFLAPDFSPNNPPSVRQHAEEADFSFLHPRHLLKAERYAVFGALIHMLTEELVEGADTDARFKNVPAGTTDSLLINIMEAHEAVFANATTRPDTRAHALMKQVVRIDPGAAETALSFIGKGGTAPAETYHFNRRLPRLLSNTPETKGLSPEARTAVAHLLVPVSLGRAAVNIETLPFRPNWRYRGRIKLDVIDRLTRTGEARRVYRLLRADGKPLFSLLAELKTNSPLLKCPAHHAIYDNAPTALSRQLHAGVNEAAARGAYDV